MQQLRKHFSIYVEASKTTPTRAGKEPKDVWVVSGVLDGLVDFIYQLGARKYKGKFSLYDDPSIAILNHLKENGRKSMSEVKKEQQVRDAEKSQKFTLYAQSNAAKSIERFETAKAAVENIPFGQPILVDHYSASRHRAAINKSNVNMRKSIEHDDKSSYWSRRARTKEIKSTGEYSLNYIANRIKECSSKLRKYKRWSEAAEKLGDHDEVIRCSDLIAIQTDQLSYWKEEMHSQYGDKKDNSSRIVAGKTEILYRGTWYPVKRVNTKTITISNWLRVENATWLVQKEKVEGVRNVGGLNE